MFGVWKVLSFRLAVESPPMARYKSLYTNPQFLSVDLARQLLPGTFEHALSLNAQGEPQGIIKCERSQLPRRP